VTNESEGLQSHRKKLTLALKNEIGINCVSVYASSLH